jgi:amino acid transporter
VEFSLVCLGVIVLRVMQPELKRPFKSPGGVILPVLGIVSCFGLLSFLPLVSLGRLAIWLGVGVVVFPLTYGVLGLLLARGLGWPALNVVIALAVTAALGLHALVYFNWLARQSRRIRLAFLKASNRRQVAALTASAAR